MNNPPLPLGRFSAGTVRRPDLYRVPFDAQLAPVPDLPAAAEAELSGLVVPYGQTANRFGGPIVFERGCLNLPDDLSTVKLLVQHDDERPVGYAIAAEDTDAGLVMTFHLADHPRATELAGEVSGKLRDGLSVGVEPSEVTFDAILSRLWGETESDDPIVFAGDLREVSAVSIPQFNDARAAAAARVATFTSPERLAMPTTVTDPPAPTAEVAHTTTPASELVITPPEPATLDQLAAAVSARMGGSLTPRGAHPLARFASFADYAVAVRDDPRLQLALVDQITTDNPGLVQPAWLTEIIGIVSEASPVATALSAGNLPADGMEIYWPTYTGNYKTLVQKQATEKTPIHSEKVSIGKGGPAEIETFAGGSDISYQLLRRSSPSYLDTYNQIMALAYAWTTEDVVSTYLVDSIGQWLTYDPANTDSDAFRAALFSASTKVWRATGTPATHVFAALNVFEIAGTMDGLENSKYGTNNVSGTASAATLEVDVNGLKVTPAPAFEDNEIVVTNKLAARYLKDGPFTVTAEDVEKLGRNVAVWGMGAFLPLRTQGIVGLSATGLPPVAADDQSAPARKASTK